MVFLDESGKDYGPLNHERTQLFKRYLDKHIARPERKPGRSFRWMVDIHLADGMSARDMTLEDWNRLNPDEHMDPPYDAVPL